MLVTDTWLPPSCAAMLPQKSSPPITPSVCVLAPPNAVPPQPATQAEMVMTRSAGQSRHVPTIGSQRRGAREASPFPHPPFKPCVRFSRTRLTDGPLGIVTHLLDSERSRATGAGPGPETSRSSTSPGGEAEHSAPPAEAGGGGDGPPHTR